MDNEWAAFLVLTGFLVVGIALQLAYFIPQFKRQQREMEEKKRGLYEDH